MSLVNKENDYSKVSVNPPSYKHIKVQPSSGGGSLNMLATSSQVLLFELPSSQSINFYESFMSWDFVLGGLGAGGFSATHVDIPPINRIALRSKSGAVMAEISNFQLYWKMVVASGLKNSEYITRSTPGVAVAIANSRLQGVVNFCNPGNALPSTATTANVPQSTCIDQAGVVNNAKTWLPAYRALMHYGSSADNTAFSMSCKLNFSDMINTIFCMNKDIYLLEGLQVEVEFCGYDGICFLHTAVGTLAGPATAGVAPVLTNIQINLALQQNSSLVKTVAEQTMKNGVSLAIPYVNMSINPLGINTSGNSVQKVSRANGQRLLRIYSAEFVSANNLALRANFFNDGATTTSFSTVLDGNKLQYSDMVVASGDDYKEMSTLLKNTVLHNLQAFYSHCGVWVDEFSGLEGLEEAKERDFNVVTGMPLDREYTWSRQIVSKTAVDTSTVVCIVGQKELTISALGITVN